MNKTANDTFADTSPYKARDTNTARILDLAVNLGAIGVSVGVPALAPGAATFKATYDFGKNYFYDQYESQSRIIPHSQQVSVNTISRMQREIRANSPEGQAYAKYFNDLLHDDPTISSDLKAPIVAANVKLLLLQKNKDRQSNVLDNGEYKRAMGKLNEAITQLRNEVAARKQDAEDEDLLNQAAASDAQAQAARQAAQEFKVQAVRQQVRDLQDARGILMIAGYIMSVTGDKEGARIANGTAEVIDKTSILVSQAANMSPMMLAAGYIGLAIMASNLIQTANQPETPYPAIFQMLREISKQINDLRVEMLNTLGRMDNRLGNLSITNIALSEAILQNTNELQMKVNDLQGKLMEAQDSLTSQNTALADMFMSAEDRDCLRVRNGQLLEPQPDFLRCQDTYLYRSTEIAKNALTNTQLSEKSVSWSAEAQSLFPFANRYQTLQSDLNIAGTPVANPSVWFEAVSRYLLLVAKYPKFIDDIDLQSDGTNWQSATLDPMIRAGEGIRDFSRDLVFENSPFVFRNAPSKRYNVGRHRQFLREMKDNYQNVLVRLQNATKSPGVLADVTNDSAHQTIDPAWEFAFSKGSGVPFCKFPNYPAGNVTASAVIGWVRTTSEGSNGSDEYLNYGDLQGTLDELLKRHPITEFQPDGTLSPIINNAVRLSEILHPGSSTPTPFQVCLQNFNVGNLQITPQSQMQADITVTFYVIAQFGKESRPLQKLTGTYHVKDDYFNFHYDYEFRHGILVNKIMKKLSGHYGEFVKASNVMPEDNLKYLTGIVDNYLEQKRNELRARTEFRTESERIEHVRNDLSMLTAVGMNMQHKKVALLYRDFNDKEKLPSVTSLIDDVILKGKNPVEVKKKIDASMNLLDLQLLELWQDIKTALDIYPPTAALNVRITQLRILKDLRSRGVSK